MKNFFNFNVDKKKDSYSASIELKNFIENVVEQDELNALYEKFSLITLIPKDVLMNKCKNILFSNFDFYKGKFNTKFNFLRTFRDAFSYLWIVACMFFLSQNNPKKVKLFDVILDDVDQENAYKRLKKLFSNFKSYFVILTEDINISNLDNSNSLYFLFNKIFFIFLLNKCFIKYCSIKL